MIVPNWPRDREGQFAEVLRRLNEAVGEADLFAFLRLLAVRDREATKWQLAFGRIDICREGEIPIGPRFRYRSAVVLAAKLSLADFLGLFRLAAEREASFPCDGFDVELLARETAWDADHHYSSNDYSSWPCSHVSGKAAAAFAPAGPFASASNHPYYADLVELIEDIAQFREFHGARDARQNGLHLFFWHYAGRIADVEFDDKSGMTVRVDGGALPKLTLVGRLVGPEGDQQVHLRAESTLTVPVSNDAQATELALVQDNDAIVDVRRVVVGSVPRRPDGADGSRDTRLRQLIQQGESATVEFKPFVRLDGPDKKWEEVLRTALAMSNARGGFVFVGINDEGVPDFGIESYKVLGLANATALQAVDAEERKRELINTTLTYGGRLRDRIQQLVKKSLVMARWVLWLDGGPVLVLRVKRGSEPPYMDKRDNSVWYRTNATNRRPDEAELARIFGSLDAQPADEYAE